MRLSLAGKPDPAMFIEAARRLSVPPCDAMVFEDAAAGVSAAAHGGFGLVVGVDRAGTGPQLTDAGADVVVSDLTQIPGSPRRPCRTEEGWCGGAVVSEPIGWKLVYDAVDPAREGTREVGFADLSRGQNVWLSRSNSR